MVQRTGLAIIILLLVLTSGLWAQESGLVPPKLMSEPVLEIPANWRVEYSPAEVIILVEVKTDSTANLVRILDGKNELRILIDRHLTDFYFTPAFIDGVPTDATLTIKLRIEKTYSPVRTAAEIQKEMDKKVLLRHTKEKLVSESIQNPFSDEFYYRTNFYLLGLNNHSDLMLKDGFVQASLPYYNSHYHQMLSSFRQYKYGAGRVSYDNYPSVKSVEDDKADPSVVMISDIHAGLGDYELNFARVYDTKNHVFGVKDFYTEFGLLVQNGWWQEILSDQTSYRAYLRYPIKGTRLSFNFEKYDQDIPSTSLLPGIQGENLFGIGHKLQNIYLKWNFANYTIGWTSNKETLSSRNNINYQEYQNQSLMLNVAHKIYGNNLDLSYQYNYQNDLPKLQQLYQLNSKAEHQGLFSSNRAGKVSYDAMVLVSEKGLDKGFAEMGYTSFLGLAGISYDLYKGQKVTDSYKVFYQTTSPDFSPAVFAANTISGFYSIPVSESYRVKLRFGSKQISVTTDKAVLYPDGAKDVLVIERNDKKYDLLFAEVNMLVSRKILGLEASLKQDLQWHQYQKGIFEIPELQMQSGFKVVRQMAHDNALSVGINLIGHSDFIKADKSNTAIYGALVADLWAGVKVTDLFEFQLMLKNTGDNILYGVYPHPRTIIGTIHWFMLN